MRAIRPSSQDPGSRVSTPFDLALAILKVLTEAVCNPWSEWSTYVGIWI